MEVTKEQFEEALKTIRAYAPGVFLDITPVETKNALKGTPENLDYLIHHDGYFHICSGLTGEIRKANVVIEVNDHCDEPLSAKAEFYLQYGVVNDKETFKPTGVILSDYEYRVLTQKLSKKETIQVGQKEYRELVFKAEMYDLNNELRRSKRKRNWIKKLFSWK